jgi:hypothetical protein
MRSLIDDAAEHKRWRDGLSLIGKPALMDQLRRYPGLPSDTVSDVPLHPPYPTREFCERWCHEAEHRSVRSYGTVIVTSVILAVVMLSYASCSISEFLNSSCWSTQPGYQPPPSTRQAQPCQSGW